MNLGAGQLLGISRNIERLPPAGLPLVLLHGIQGTADAWLPVIGHFPKDIPVIAPHFRGRAGSHCPESATEYGLDGFAEDLATVLAVLDRPAVVAAWSMGVLVALAYIKHRGLADLRGLIFISGTACGHKCHWFSGRTLDEVKKESQARATALGLTKCAEPAAVAGAWLSVRESDLEDVFLELTRMAPADPSR